MRNFPQIAALTVVLLAAGCMSDQVNASPSSKLRSQCADFGFHLGTDAFANCMMQLSLKQKDSQPPDHFALVDKYRKLSQSRQGDDRYPVCSTGNMDAELDITIGEWVGPNCQVSSD